MAYGSGRGGGFERSGGGFNRGGGNFRRSFGPREMHKIKCSECGKDAEVPFVPRNDSPVYCRECFFKKKGMTPRSDGPKFAPKPKKEEFAEDEETKGSEEESEEDLDEDEEEEEEESDKESF